MLLLLCLLTYNNSCNVEGFTRPLPILSPPALKGSTIISVSNKHVQRRYTSTSFASRKSSTTTLWQGKQKAANTDTDNNTNNNDGDTITAAENSEQVASAAAPPRKQPTLAELEDVEEARLAAEEEAAAAELQSSSDPKFAGPSNLYNDVYSVNPKAISKITAEQLTNLDPLNISPQKEIQLAQKRDALQNNRLNEMFAEEDTANLKRQEKIQQLMDEDDKVWKAERRKRQLGKYANVKDWKEVEKMLDDDRNKEVKGKYLCCIRSVCVIQYICGIIIIQHSHSHFN